MTISDLFEQAQLAEAAYADLWDIDLNTAITARDDVMGACGSDRRNALI